MGSYIKKSKLAGDVSLKDISHPTTYNFRTRAATNLTLQRLRSHSVSPSVDDVDSFHYLQLRSGRLVKLPLLADTTKQQLKQLVHGVHKSQTRSRRAKLERYESETTVVVTEKDEDCGNNVGKSEFDCNFGEAGFDFESRDSLRGDSEAIQSIPSSREIEEFFAYAEEQQHRFFNEKYNFDIVSKNPLPGRYEWTKVVL